MNKYKRTNFMKVVKNSDDVEEFDFLLNNWDLFEIKDQISFDSVRKYDMRRPDILSYRVYGDSKYWWILCKVNNIDDVWNDMELGKRLIVPSIYDIENFYIKVRKRFRA